MIKISNNYTLRDPEYMDDFLDGESPHISFVAEMLDDDIEKILSRTSLIQDAGFKNFEEVLDCDNAYCNIYACVYRDKAVKLFVSIDLDAKCFGTFCSDLLDEEKKDFLHVAEMTCIREQTTLDDMIAELND